MTEFSAPETAGGAGAPSAPPVTAAVLAYALTAAAGVAGLLASGMQFIAPLFGVLGIAGVIVCYMKRDEAQGSWVASHLRWLIRTFWFSLLWSAIGWIPALTVVGLIVAIPLWFVVSLWIIYRVLRGYLLFKDSRPVPGM